MMKRPLKSAIAVFALINLVPVAIGATDGYEGATSTASLELSMTLSAVPAAMIRISGLTDVSFSKNVGDAQLPSEVTGACVHMTEPGTYSIKVTANPLTSSDNQSYPFTLSIDDLLSNYTDSVDVTDQVGVIQGQNLVPSNKPGCDNVNTLELTFTETGDLTEAFSATSTIVLTVTAG